MYLLSNYSRQISEFVTSHSRSVHVRVATCLLIVLAAIATVILHFGAPVMNGRPWDVPALLDGGWRIMNGQVPYRDFFIHHGPLALYLTALGMKLGHPSVACIDVGALCFMGILTLVALIVLGRRTSAFYSFIFSLLIALLIIAPRPLGDPYDFTDHALIFTRFGEALLMLLSIILFIPPIKTGGIATETVEMMLSGLLITLMIFNKVNYAL